MDYNQVRAEVGLFAEGRRHNPDDLRICMDLIGRCEALGVPLDIRSLLTAAEERPGLESLLVALSEKVLGHLGDDL